MPAMRSINERVELEMKLIRYRQFLRRITDREFITRIPEQIAQTEQKLRELDE
jgi:hypothetical protein